MGLTERYVRRHEISGDYETKTGILHQNRRGWCDATAGAELIRSEERRVGKEC